MGTKAGPGAYCLKGYWPSPHFGVRRPHVGRAVSGLIRRTNGLATAHVAVPTRDHLASLYNPFAFIENRSRPSSGVICDRP